jgi:quinol-cytochrome oxidoreductase complex cytochrome b subunit
VTASLTSSSDWLKTRIKNIDIFDEHYQLEAKTNPFYALGPIFYLVWFIVIVSGLLLIMWYVPTKAGAFDSILNIQNGIPIGGLVRGMHKYGADAMIIAAMMRLYRMFIMADYKPAKELNIAIGLVTLLLSMYSGLTGYLLIWNQRAFWATKVFATFPTYMDQFAIMGDFYQPLYKSLHMGWNTAEILLGGGAAITQNTITRFFSIHMAFSLIPLILVELYFFKNAYTRIPLNWTKRSIVTLMIAFVAIALPAAQGSRSDPDVTPLPILSDWYFLGLYQMYKYLEPVVATYITLVIPVSVILLPFLDTWITGPEKNILKRPFILMITIMGAMQWIVFSILIIVNIANIHTDPPIWRSSLYLMINIGVIWQTVLILKNKNLLEKAKMVRPCVIMAVISLIQTFFAGVYFYMAKTEMFIDPLGHGALYSMARPFMGKTAEEAEGIVRKMHPTNGEAPVNKEYWNYPVILDSGYEAKVGQAAGKEDIVKLAELVKSTSAIDLIARVIPTFETPMGPNEQFKEVKFADPKRGPHPVYVSMLDFMVNNRWCWDYCTLVDRLDGKVKTYPMSVPEGDWWWMLGGALASVVALYGAFQAKLAQAAAKAKG